MVKQYRFSYLFYAPSNVINGFSLLHLYCVCDVAFFATCWLLIRLRFFGLQRPIEKSQQKTWIIPFPFLILRCDNAPSCLTKHHNWGKYKHSNKWLKERLWKRKFCLYWLLPCCLSVKDICTHGALHHYKGRVRITSV